MINAQVSMVNEWSIDKCSNALSIEHCLLNITVQKGAV